MLIVIAYDIPNDRRRVRMHTLLSGYGEPVQHSVFECDLDDAALRKLRVKVARMIRPGDKVRLYPLCGACAGRIDDGLGNRPEQQPSVYIV